MLQNKKRSDGTCQVVCQGSVVGGSVHVVVQWPLAVGAGGGRGFPVVGNNTGRAYLHASVCMVCRKIPLDLLHLL